MADGIAISGVHFPAAARLAENIQATIHAHHDDVTSLREIPPSYDFNFWPDPAE